MGGWLDAYLIFYNLACILGWLYIDCIVFSHFADPAARFNHAALWAAVSLPLKVVQTSALLEVLHALLGWVRSNAATAFLQVVARGIVLWAMMHPFPSAQGSWACALCVAAWAAVEVPRYLFYTCELVRGKGGSPYWLQWLRYSLFIPLYPLGIAGELGCLLHALPYAGGQFAWNRAPGPGNPLNIACVYHPHGPPPVRGRTGPSARCAHTNIHTRARARAAATAAGTTTLSPCSSSPRSTSPARQPWLATCGGRGCSG